MNGAFDFNDELRKTSAYRDAFSHFMNDGCEGTEKAKEEGATNSWPEPEPLTRELPLSDPYPVEAFGDVLGDAVKVLSGSIS